MKNLLFLIGAFGLGGTEKNAYIYMKSLMGEYNVYAASLFKGGERFLDFQNIAEDILIADGNYCLVKDFISKNKIDIVYMHSISGHKNSNDLLEFLKWLNDKKIKIIETSQFSLYTPDTERFIDYKLFVSKASLLKFIWKFKNPKITKYDYLYNNIDPDILGKYIINGKERENERKKLGINKDDFVVGKIGRADLWKWDDTIIDIVPLLNSIPNLKILIRALPEYKMKKIKKMGLEKFFILLPESVKDRDIANTYQIMDVMLHTSRIGESFGVALVEGMFYGLPILTIDTDWMQWTAFDRDNSQGEILGEQNSNFISNDIKYIAKKIIELYKNETLRREIGNKNAKRAEKFFVNNLKKKLIQIINKTDASIDFDYDKELVLYKKRVIKSSFLERLNLSIKAIYEHFKL